MAEQGEMVRVQLGPNDIRRYRRAEAEQVVMATPGARILEDVPAEAPSRGGETDAKMVPGPPATKARVGSEKK